MDKREQLLPCPFCGGEPRTVTADDWVEVICNSCECSIDTVEAWNTRQAAQAAPQPVEPDGYLYRYHAPLGGIHTELTNRHWNGNYAFRVDPYWLATPPLDAGRAAIVEFSIIAQLLDDIAAAAEDGHAKQFYINEARLMATRLRALTSPAAQPERDGREAKAVAYVPHCFADCNDGVEGEYRFAEVSEMPFEVSDPEHWECRPLYPPRARCWCETCRPNTLTDMRMVVCPDCGNKRCPHATDHRNACTNSNEPGQPGSSFENCRPAPERDCAIPSNSGELKGAAQPEPGAVDMALAVLEANHKWHEMYDDYGGYPDSELCEQNTSAIGKLRALRKQEA